MGICVLWKQSESWYSTSVHVGLSQDKLALIEKTEQI